MAGWHEDLVSAWRAVLRRPGRSLIVVLGLALGLGTCGAVFTYLDFLLWAELPARQPERLATVDEISLEPSGLISLPDYIDYRDRNPVFTGLAAAAAFGTTVDTGGATFHAWGHLVSGNFFDLLGVPPRLGRTVGLDDDRPGAEPAIVLSDGFWRGAFASDPGVVGRVIRVNERPMRVVGVMPEAFAGNGFPTQLYLALVHDELVRPAAGRRANRQEAWLNLTGRLRPGVSLAAAQDAMTVLGGALDRIDPRPGKPRRFRITPGGHRVDPETSASFLPAVHRILAFAVLLLFLACANASNLLLASAVDRRSELAVRVALGAGRWRLVRPMLFEGVLLALGGGALGIALAQLGSRFIERGLSEGLGANGLGNWAEGIISLRLDLRVVAFSLALALTAGVLSGLLPALRATTRSRLVTVGRGAIGDTGTGSRWGAAVVLVVLQVAMSTWLVTGTGLLAVGLWRLAQTPTGWSPANLWLATMSLPQAEGGQTARQVAIYQQMADEVRNLPGVAATSLSFGVPLSGIFRTESFELPERRGERLEINTLPISPAYFETLAIRRLAGRDIEPRDDENAARVAVVNQAFAAKIWPGKDAIGRHLLVPGKPGSAPASPAGDLVEVVGVVADTRAVKLWERPAPTVYLPLTQRPHRLVTLFVRTAGTASPGGIDAGLGAVLRRELRRQHPEMAILDVRPAADQLVASLWNQRLNAELLAIFGGLGLALAAFGLGSAMSFSVARRRREIGVRMALGSTSGGVQALILGRALAQLGVGVAAGLLAAVAFVRVLAKVVEGTEVTPEPWSLLAATLVLATVGLAAAWAPARRAAETDPCEAIRAA